MRIAVAISILLLVYGCSRPQAFDYRGIRNVKVEKLGFEKSTFVMDLVYYNPNNYGVQLRNVDCEVYINNNYLGRYSLDTLMNIPRKAEFSLPSKMQVEMRNIFKTGLNALFSKEVLVKVKGTTRLGKGGILLNVPVNYEGRHKVELF